MSDNEAEAFIVHGTNRVEVLTKAVATMIEKILEDDFEFVLVMRRVDAQQGFGIIGSTHASSESAPDFLRKAIARLESGEMIDPSKPITH